MQWHIPRAYHVGVDCLHALGDVLCDVGLKLKTGKPLRFHWLGRDTDGYADVRGLRNLSDGSGNECLQPKSSSMACY